MPNSQLALVLHAHLPFVRHPEHPQFLEELWLFEAITETYVPLLRVLDSLVEAGVRFRLTLSLSPPLAAMLRDPLLVQRYLAHLDRLAALAEAELHRTRGDPELAPLARMYADTFAEVRRAFVERYRCDLVAAFGALADAGVLDLVTTAATHAFLPLLGDERLVRAQLAVGLAEHRRHFGRAPAGMWLPECGYRHELDAPLAELGVGWVVLEAHGLLFATPRPSFGVYAPVRSPAGVAFFARDPDSSRQVWSATGGYPGHPDYREFYRDVAFELDEAVVRPFLHAGIRTNLGLKYRRITGPTDDKQPYVRARALVRADEHAAHFVEARRRQASALEGIMPDRAPVVVAPYDAELFGHWWYEGPDWLGHVLQRACAPGSGVTLTTPGDVLASGVPVQTASPAASSWGEHGYSGVWLDPSNDWIYPHLHAAGARLLAVVDRCVASAPGPLPTRALTQAGRELLLAQSSDWAFILRTGAHASYAERRTREHVAAVLRLCDELEAGMINEPLLRDLEDRHNVFPDLDWRVFT
jgi:1,4-alpha-glucan branching enzyme